MNEIIPSILFGALITWYIADRYYKTAAVDLEKEALELKRLNNLLLDGMEHMGWININRSRDGTINGFEKRISTPGFDSFKSGNHKVGQKGSD